MATVLQISPAQARNYLLNQLDLCQDLGESDSKLLVDLLQRRRCIQIDPLDPLGPNAELVAAARLQNYQRGQLFDASMAAHSFEHYAKELCLMPSAAFRYYKNQARQTPWWRLGERKRKLPPKLIQGVLKEFKDRGPMALKDLSDWGKVEAVNYSGWKGTSKAASMATEVLWIQCKLVVARREGKHKVYDLPERLYSKEDLRQTRRNYLRWALMERVEAAGLLKETTGPQWSMLKEARENGLIEQLVEEKKLCWVQVEGHRRNYLAPPDFLERAQIECDERMRILGPLDPILWDRELVHHVFDFEYLWEVYKPAAKRRWGWYVVPLLHRGQLVGRIDAKLEKGEIVVSKLWKEKSQKFSQRAYKKLLQEHARSFARN